MYRKASIAADGSYIYTLQHNTNAVRNQIAVSVLVLQIQYVFTMYEQD